MNRTEKTRKLLNEFITHMGMVSTPGLGISSNTKLTKEALEEKQYEAYIDDTRKPGGPDEEIKQDYNLEVYRYDDDTFTVVGKKTDILDFIEDYDIRTTIKAHD